MLNGNRLLFELLKPVALDLGVTLKADIDVTSIDVFPFATFTGRPGAALNDRGTTTPMAWEWSLDMSFFDVGEQATFDLASAFYDHVHSFNLDTLWAPPGTVRTDLIEGLGHAANVSDRTVPSKVGSADIKGHFVVQYSGGWDLQLHQA